MLGGLTSKRKQDLVVTVFTEEKKKSRMLTEHIKENLYWNKGKKALVSPQGAEVRKVKRSRKQFGNIAEQDIFNTNETPNSLENPLIDPIKEY